MTAKLTNDNATGWTPDHLIDEAAPDPRPSPQAWIVATDDGYMIDGFEGMPDTCRPIKPGERIKFQRLHDFGWLEVDFTPSGFTVTGGVVHPGASTFMIVGDPDTMSNSLADLHQTLIDADAFTATDPLQEVVSHYHFEPMEFVFDLVDGNPALTLASVEAEART